MKVRDLFDDWPPSKWAAENPYLGALTSDAGELRLLWFSAADEDGWFRLSATDAQGRSWSTYCRAPTLAIWRALEQALGASLRMPLAAVGDAELSKTARSGGGV